jgi:hypothetical protein
VLLYIAIEVFARPHTRLSSEETTLDVAAASLLLQALAVPVRGVHLPAVEEWRAKATHQGFCWTHVQPELQHVGPLKPCPPHCPHGPAQVPPGAAVEVVVIAREVVAIVVVIGRVVVPEAGAGTGAGAGEVPPGMTKTGWEASSARRQPVRATRLSGHWTRL